MVSTKCSVGKMQFHFWVNVNLRAVEEAWIEWFSHGELYTAALLWIYIATVYNSVTRQRVKKVKVTPYSRHEVLQEPTARPMIILTGLRHWLWHKVRVRTKNRKNTSIGWGFASLFRFQSAISWGVSLKRSEMRHWLENRTIDRFPIFMMLYVPMSWFIGGEHSYKKTTECEP